MRKSVLALLFLSEHAYPQTPVIADGGIVNAASWGGIVAPGSLVSVFGTNLAPTTSVSVNGITAPVLFVSPGQLNLQLPSSLGISAGEITGGSLVVTTPVGSSAPAQVTLSSSGFGFFTADSSGCGQAAAQNIRPDGTTSINSHANSAAPGDYIALYGTGLGSSDAVRLFLDNSLTPTPLYAGPAPGLAGVDQINFQVPANTRNGCSVPITAAALQTFSSPAVTIAVQSGRGQCADPPITSYGEIYFSSFNGSDSFVAQFPSGPNVKPPPPGQVDAAVGFISSGVFLTPNDFRSCAVPGYSHLSEGPIQIQSPAAGTVTTQPLPLVDGATYSQSLPPGFISAGTYTISATNWQTSFHIGSPIQIQNNFSQGTVISSTQPLTITWTGGDPGTLVTVDSISADASTGSLTIPPPIPARIYVFVAPAPNNVLTTSVPGITGPVQINWSYSYTFTGLTVN